MDERNLINGSLVSYLSWAADFISPIRWFLLAAFALVLADLKFGIEAARHRGETIRKSRAIRRSANKIIDYLCWILVATSFGEAFGTPFGIPILPALVLLVVYGCEINRVSTITSKPMGKQTANQHLQMVKKQVRYYGPLRR